ncbi:restriction endonuclease subunit R [Trichothermofontia sp.]
MTQASIAAADTTLQSLKQSLGLQLASNPHFFPEWTPELTMGPDSLINADRKQLNRVKTNFLEMLEDPPVLENSVKMVVLSPLLDLAGFYRHPFRIATETSIAIALEDEGITIGGRIDILVIKANLWITAIESKRSDFAVTRAIPQTLSYMLGHPSLETPTFGLITNGTDFLFLKAQRTPTPQYAMSRLFSLINPNNELHDVLAILKYLGSL